jgi:hypothetical protein
MLDCVLDHLPEMSSLLSSMNSLDLTAAEIYIKSVDVGRDFMLEYT